MCLQNRVMPDGTIVAVPTRGLFMGNRGRIHDSATKQLLNRGWTLKAWLICATSFNGRRRALMSVNSYTELFFLDEVTAFAAGHRPCYECRRQAFRAYSQAWKDGFELHTLPTAAQIDLALHAERLERKSKRTHLLPRDTLPSGAMIDHDGFHYALCGEAFLQWNSAGYAPEPHPVSRFPQMVKVLTPPSTLAVLRAGYQPVWHQSGTSLAPVWHESAHQPSMK
ncbi:MAG: hypothetical protein H2045_05055 [Rhizobiales bacterium]|nr:hypothetical protein [Hyphomicrobiales bacterium]